MQIFSIRPETGSNPSNLPYSQCFLLELKRRVSADSVIVIDEVEYEVDYRFAKQRIPLRYSPDMKDIFIVERDGSLTPIRLLNKQDNAPLKRKKIHLREVKADRILFLFRIGIQSFSGKPKRNPYKHAGKP